MKIIAEGLLIFAFLFGLTACGIFRATGETVEATGEGVSQAVVGVGQGAGEAVSETGRGASHIVKGTGRAIADMAN